MGSSPFRTKFVKIQNTGEKARVWQSVFSNKISLVLKSDDDSIFLTSLMGLKVGPGSEVKGSVPGPTEQEWAPGSSFLCTFFDGQDRYFYSGKVMDKELHSGANSQAGSPLTLDLDGEMFRIDRRQSFRVEVPRSVPIYLSISEVDGRKVTCEALVADISPGGVKVYFTSQSVNLGVSNILQVQIHPPAGVSIEATANVRHVRSMIFENELIPQYGLEFTNLNPRQIERLYCLAMELQRRQLLNLTDGSGV